MATTETEAEAAGTEAEFRPHRIAVDRLENMIQAGVFDGPERVFLWDGRLYEKLTPGQPHVYIVMILRRMLDQLVSDGWYCLQEQPIAVGGVSMPEPDLSVVRGTLRDYLARRPTTRDVSVVVEVSDSSLGFDSKEKLRAYAANAVPAYWIVGISKRRIEVHSAPSGSAYGEHRRYGPGEEVPVVLDGREMGRVAIDAVFP